MTNPSFLAANGRPANGQRPVSQPDRTNITSNPAPRGLNSAVPLAGMSPQDCIYTYNLLPDERGLKTRKGYREWANALGTPIAPESRTILPFVGDREDRFNDKLFACNDQGIFDITASGTGLAPVFTWATQGGVAGYSVYTHYTNDAGAHFLMIADEANGVHEYDEATGTWAASTGITGPTVANVIFITSHQRRLWMIEQDSSVAWYLPAGAKAGAATQFNFGAQFREGGTLIGLYSWTVDGGDGVDDYMVAVSREGGIAIYRGSDPANASTWALVGVWYIGRVPAGHRVASQYGGQLFILSENGLININRLIQGSSLEEAAMESAAEVSPFVRARINATLEQRGWEIRVLSADNFFMVNSPLNGGANRHIHYVRNLTTQGWGFGRGLPWNTGDVFQGKLYFADNDGSIFVHDGLVDNALLDGTPGVDIEFSMLTAFSDMGYPGFKIGQICRPHFLSAGKPSFSVQARWDFDLSENNANISFQPSAEALWDQALWDQAIWAGGLGGTESVRGISSMGHYLAIALKGTTSQELTLLSIETQATPGGTL